jgi:hypothetical protein
MMSMFQTTTTTTTKNNNNNIKVAKTSEGEREKKVLFPNLTGLSLFIFYLLFYYLELSR